MKIEKFLPTPAKLSQEVIATLGAIIISALIIKNFPALRALVKDSEPLSH